MQNYNPEHIVLSVVTRQSSQDVNIMKEKLIFSGAVVTFAVTRAGRKLKILNSQISSNSQQPYNETSLL